MQLKSFKQWFVFTKRDRNAVVVLIVLIGVIIFLPFLSPKKNLEIHLDKELQQELDAYKQANQQTGNNFYYADVDSTIQDTLKQVLFLFDPNTLPEDGFIKLGVSSKTTHTIINYRSKGGYFKSPEDIRKIYGLPKTMADKLIPYIHIAAFNTKPKQQNNYEQPVTAATHKYKKININTATAEDWKAFSGIGDVIANRIIKFRTSIHDFTSVDDVAKTYGLSESVFQNIKPYLYLKDSAGN